jgi:hypothetical protein
MKSIPELKKGDMINVNGEIYQLIGHAGLEGSEKGEMMVELGRLGDKNPTPILRVIYPPENPLSLRLEEFDKKTSGWKTQKLTKFGF